MTAVNFLFAEDYKAGDRFRLGEYTVSRKEMVEFARQYDPFPFHIDDEAARTTLFGGIVSSGWLTGLIWLRLMHRTVFSAQTTLGSPGHNEMKWPAPVRPGDRLRGYVEVIESRISTSRPEIDFVRYNPGLTKQTGEPVFVTASTMIVRTRAGTRVQDG